MRDITLGETFYHFFTTRAFATGIPTTLAGTPVLSVLEENNVTPITAGVSVSVDRATVVGMNQATIVATGANGYEVGKSYAIYISTGTVGGVSVVGEVVGEFTIQASAAAVDLANATDGLSALKTLIDAVDNFVDTEIADIQARLPAALTAGGNIKADALAWNALATVALPLIPTVAGRTLDVSAGGEAGLDWANIGSPTTAVDLSGTRILIHSGIKKNVAMANFKFLMTDSTNHAPATGLTVTVARAIDGGAFAAGALSAVTEVAFGIYRVDFAASDLNGDNITFRATAAASDDLLVTIETDL